MAHDRVGPAADDLLLLLRLKVTDLEGRKLGWKGAALRFLVFAWGPATG